MKQVTKEQFFSRVGKLDVLVSCKYSRGCHDGITSTFKTRGGSIMGTIKGQLFGKPTTYYLQSDQA